RARDAARHGRSAVAACRELPTTDKVSCQAAVAGRSAPTDTNTPAARRPRLAPQRVSPAGNRDETSPSYRPAPIPAHTAAAKAAELAAGAAAQVDWRRRPMGASGRAAYYSWITVCQKSEVRSQHLVSRKRPGRIGDESCQAVF